MNKTKAFHPETLGVMYDACIRETHNDGTVTVVFNSFGLNPKKKYRIPRNHVSVNGELLK